MNPFTIKEIGRPGAQQAVADFTCPKCGEFTRFTTRDETPDGGFVCPHCGLKVSINGTRLSDYQQQLEAIDRSLHDFAGRVRDRVKRAAEDITAETADEAANDPDGTKNVN